MPPSPHFVDPQISYLCRMVLPKERVDEKKDSGPHNQASINIYTNALGKKAFANKRKTYPVGTLILKEKHPSSHQKHSIGGMIKQIKGYNPQNGDWSYFYQTTQGKLSYERIESCQKCHTRAKKQDFVFKKWLKSKRHPALPPNKNAPSK